MRVLTAVVLLLALASPAAALAAGDEGAELKARTHFAAGEYKEALEIYARLYAETMHPTYLRNIARCHQNLGNPDKAISSFREYLRKARDLPPDERAEIEGYIAEMEQLKQQSKTATAPRRRRRPRRRARRPPNRPPGAGRPADRDGVRRARRRRRPVLHARLVLGRGRGRRGRAASRPRSCSARDSGPAARQPGRARPAGQAP